MNPWWIVAGGLALGAGAWAVAASSRKPTLGKGDRLWVIGDSLGVGLLPRLVKLGSAAGIEVGGNPKGGTMTFQWAKKFDLLDPILNAQAQHVLVVLGTNDAAGNSTYVHEQFAGYVDALAKRLTDESLQVTWLMPGTSPGLPQEKTDTVADIILARSHADGFAVLDTNEAPVQYVHADVHPTPAGYDTLAAWIMTRLTT